ncbi:sulfite exporter TauE/SafE family protein [Paenibacillus sp. HN-1]|uniref:urease accessory protein UreH domain-containing protein n=1 Tax=Paenibacillus TaxID=44249 RepID=UPI001CA7D9C2|nr:MULTISPECIES: sulfite exporter TauE/SafE family protein [Paenibacillus]MBY9079267.1 sulfite exporter TauE/SafE family protein [Paenibacillus sp. CGMCC 1.18879]MBY9086990.1 sulfite exporter TauE/SafE family protein [Paenibacillus sinensis]
MSDHLTDTSHADERNLRTRDIGKGIRWFLAAAVILSAAMLLWLHPEWRTFLLDLVLMKNVPQLSMDAGYGMIFTVGILTSFHCAGMCGGIAISQSMRSRNKLNKLERLQRYIPSIRYNGGRIISYTLFGGLAGGIGQVFQLPGIWRGIIPLIGGLFMIIMGFNLLGLFKVLRRFNLSMPSFAFNVIRNGASGLGPLAVGLLSALMPCGPLQIMQLYALGTGSVVHGALSMLAFSLGTVPMLFLFGAIHPMLSKKFAGQVLKASAVIVIILGLVMLNRGFALAGISLPYEQGRISPNAVIAELNENGQTQLATAQAGKNSYPQIVVQKGIPVTWNLHIEQENLNTCNDALSIPRLKIEQKLQAGDNLISFTPKEEGVYEYSCWMGMIRSSIVVVDDVGRYDRNRLLTVSGTTINSTVPSPQITSGASPIPTFLNPDEGNNPHSYNGHAAATAVPPAKVGIPSAEPADSALHQIPSPKASAVPASKPTPTPGHASANGRDHKEERRLEPTVKPATENKAKSADAATQQPKPSTIKKESAAATVEPTPAASAKPTATAKVDASHKPKPAATAQAVASPKASPKHDQEIQTVVTIVKKDSYSPITVKRGIPVKWIIRVSREQLNDCNNEIIVPAFHLRKKLVPGDNVVEFTPTEAGDFSFTCWMEMIESHITVTE